MIVLLEYFDDLIIFLKTAPIIIPKLFGHNSRMPTDENVTFDTKVATEVNSYSHFIPTRNWYEIAIDGPESCCGEV